MKAGADALGNLAYKVLEAGVNDEFGRAAYQEPRPNESVVQFCEEAEVAVAICKALALRQKRITIDVVYPKPPTKGQ